jgi:hypothetical protein
MMYSGNPQAEGRHELSNSNFINMITICWSAGTDCYTHAFALLRYDACTVHHATVLIYHDDTTACRMFNKWSNPSTQIKLATNFSFVLLLLLLDSLHRSFSPLKYL